MTAPRRAREWSEIVETTLDEMLRILENPTRRKILERLVRESHYPLQLSKELGVSQPAVVKHLRALEEGGLVSSTEEKSDLGGPNRRAYRAKQHFSVQIDLGPSLFRAEMRPLEEDDSKVTEYAWAEDALQRARAERDPRRRVRGFADVIRKLNREMREIDRRRAYLVKLKDACLREVHGAVEVVLGSYEERQVLYCLLDEGRPALDEISEALNLREKVVADLIRKIEREFPFDWGT